MSDYVPAKQAWLYLRTQLERSPDRTALDEYFKVYQAKPAPSMLDFAKSAIVPTPALEGKPCIIVRWGADETHCAACGLTWSRGDEKPPCSTRA